MDEKQIQEQNNKLKLLLELNKAREEIEQLKDENSRLRLLLGVRDLELWEEKEKNKKLNATIDFLEKQLSEEKEKNKRMSDNVTSTTKFVSVESVVKDLFMIPNIQAKIWELESNSFFCSCENRREKTIKELKTLYVLRETKEALEKIK